MLVLLRDDEDECLHYVLDTHNQLNSIHAVFVLLNLRTWDSYAVVGADKLRVTELDISNSYERQLVRDLYTLCETKHQFVTGRSKYLDNVLHVRYQDQSYLLLSLEQVHFDHVLAQTVNMKDPQSLQFKRFDFCLMSFPTDEYGIKQVAVQIESPTLLKTDNRSKENSIECNDV